MLLTFLYRIYNLSRGSDTVARKVLALPVFEMKQWKDSSELLTPWDARVLRPGQGPRISFGAAGCQGWAASLTNFADVSLSGPGGSSGGAT